MAKANQKACVESTARNAFGIKPRPLTDAELQAQIDHALAVAEADAQAQAGG